jgi:hypothetical protein
MPLQRTLDIIYSDIPLSDKHQVGLSTKKHTDLLLLVDKSVDYTSVKKQVKGIVLQTADKKVALKATTKKLCDYLLFASGIDQTIAKNCANKSICVLFSIQQLKESQQNPQVWSQLLLDLYVCIQSDAPYSFVSLTTSAKQELVSPSTQHKTQNTLPVLGISFVQRQALARVLESYARELGKNN